MEYEIKTKCPCCGRTNKLILNDKEYKNYIRWKNREICIQEAFPKWSPDERELLLTGICEECWNEAFGIETFNNFDKEDAHFGYEYAAELEEEANDSQIISEDPRS